MRKIYFILLLILSFDVIDSIGQPLAPRNRTKRRPVLESFGGGGCVFCVPADLACKELGRTSCPFTWISYHAGIYAVPKDSTSPDLRTQCGNSLHDSLRINLYPSAFIDRSYGPLLYTNWSAINDPSIIGFATINIGVETKYDINLNKTEIDVELYRFDDYKDSFCYLSVLVIEDNVVAPQLISGTNWKNDYLHSNVFRDHITSCFGDRVDSLMIEVPLRRHYSYSIPKHIKSKNGYIVALITDFRGRIVNSEVQPLTGGRTNVGAFLDDESNEELILEKFDSISRVIHFTSYEKDSTEYCFVISKDVAEWNASIMIGKIKSFDTIRMWMVYGQTIEVNIDLAPIPMRTYGNMLFQIWPNCIKDSCHILYFKSFTVQPGSPVIVIYNTAVKRDGGINTVNLWKPITDVLEEFPCDNYVVLKEQSFEAVYNFRQQEKVNTSAIYYAAGWGNPSFLPHTISYFDSLIKTGTDVFLAGQDIANSLQYSSWFEKTVGAFFVKDGDTSYNEVKVDDKDPVFGKFGSSKILPIYQNGNSQNIFPDVITVDQLVNHKFLFNNKKTSIGFYKETAAGKVVFVCVGMEMLEKEFARNILKATHTWFDECSVTNTNHPVNLDESDDIEVKCINESISISLEDLSGKYNFQLINLEGKKIMEYQLPDYTTNVEVLIPKLPVGIYFYLLSDSENRKYYKGKCLIY